MMKLVLLVTVSLVMSVSCQNRPFYAPRPHSYPTLLSRFGDSSTDGDLGNRLGETVTSTPIQLSGGSVVDSDLANRIASWPVDKRPFWYLNQQAINAQIAGSPSALQPPPPQSSFIAG